MENCLGGRRSKQKQKQQQQFCQEQQEQQEHPVHLHQLQQLQQQQQQQKQQQSSYHHQQYHQHYHHYPTTSSSQQHQLHPHHLYQLEQQQQLYQLQQLQQYQQRSHHHHQHQQQQQQQLREKYSLQATTTAGGVSGGGTTQHQFAAGLPKCSSSHLPSTNTTTTSAAAAAAVAQTCSHFSRISDCSALPPSLSSMSTKPTNGPPSPLGTSGGNQTATTTGLVHQMSGMLLIDNGATAKSTQNVAGCGVGGVAAAEQTNICSIGIASTNLPSSTSSSVGGSNCNAIGNRSRFMPLYPDDPDAIEICEEQEPISIKSFRNKKSPGIGRSAVSLSQDTMTAKWSRNNMDKVLPQTTANATTSAGAAGVHHPMVVHQDYSYAYYEPGAAMRHSNIPPPEQVPGPSSRPPPPNSIRALLSKGKKNKLLVSPATRQSYQTRYGGCGGSSSSSISGGKSATGSRVGVMGLGIQENFYEEISGESRNQLAAAAAAVAAGISGAGGGPSMRGGPTNSSHSAGSLNQSMVEEEFRRVQSRHRKILGELNLSVEAMLMPESPPNGSPTTTTATTKTKTCDNADDDGGAHTHLHSSSGGAMLLPPARLTSGSSDNISEINLSELLGTVGPTDDLLSPITNTNPAFCGDLDSGFSGSSGASYIGSLRLHKTNAALTNLMTARQATTNTCTGNRQNVHPSSSSSSSACGLAFGSNSCRSSQRSQDECSGSGNSGFLTRTACGHRVLNCAKIKAAEDPGPSVPTESKARSFWNRKGWRKLPGFSSTSSINDAGILDEPKLNSGSWEDPLPVTTSSNTGITTAQLHNTSLRRPDPLNTRSSYNGLQNQLILPPPPPPPLLHHHQHSKSCGSPTALTIGSAQQQQQHLSSQKLNSSGATGGLGGGGGILTGTGSSSVGTIAGGSIITGGSGDGSSGGGSGGGGGGVGGGANSSSSGGKKRLEHTPSARTINSSEDSWCSERSEQDLSNSSTSDEEEEEEVDVDGEIPDADRNSERSNSITSAATHQRNSQLRSTFNKAKQHLSFDKWRTSGGSNNSNSSSTSAASANSSSNRNNNGAANSISSPAAAAAAVGIGAHQSTSSISSSDSQNKSSTMASAQHHHSHHQHHHHHHHHNQQQQQQQQESTTPGETPAGRLSRWFSMRRGSSHQYDVGGRDGRHSSSSSIDTTDATAAAVVAAAAATVTSSCLDQHSSPKMSSNSYKMPELPENEGDDPSHNNFGLDLMIPPGSRANGTARPHNRLIAPMLPPAPQGLSQQQLKRRHIVAAIVHSENSYVATLQRLVNDYKKPLEESSPPVLSSSKISILFHRLPDILQSHKLFRIALAECVRNWDRDEKLGDVFVSAFSKPSVLEVYSGFINNFSAAMELAKMEEKRKSALADFFKVKQISAHDRLSFFGLMVKPVQRFPQFILFLQDLLKYTPQGHHDRMSLQLALTQLELLAEMLNERKREAEQYQGFKEMLGHISGTFNTRSLTSTNDGNRPRYLLREDNVTHMEFNQSGFIVKSKQRRLLLLNDKVICVSVAPKQSHDFGATEKLSFKWMYPVTDVEIVDNSTSATLSRILTAGLNRGGSLKSNSSSCNNDSPATILTNGADNLCNEMSTLMYDYEVISRIHDLVGSLKGNYKELNSNITRNLLNTIQGSIQRKDEEMAWVDSCCLQLIARSKSGKEETFTFQTQNPSVKKEWITELRLAQLALDGSNSPAWEVSERHHQNIVHKPSTKMPLFVKAMPVFKSQHQTEVRCGCYYTIANDTKVGTARRRFKQQNYLWVCTSDGTSSHIAVLSQHYHQAGNLRDAGSFDLVETQVSAMEFVKGLDNCKTKEEHNSLLGDLIWMGTDSRKILIYSAMNPEQEEQLGCCMVPASVMKILYHFDSVFVALSNATLLIYRRAFDGVWILKEPQVVQLGESSLPVASILPINMNIYASCSNRVFVLNALTGDIQKNFEVQHGASQQVNAMAHSGIGLWISLKNSTNLCLYHTETFKHLQDINIASSVLRNDSSSTKKETVNNNSIFVTALMACKGLLWVGTNVGIAVTIPLPRLEGVPIIGSGVNMSCHAHFGPITFLLPLLPKVYSNYKPQQYPPQPHNAAIEAPPQTTPPPPQPPLAPSALSAPLGGMGEDLQLPAIDSDEKSKDDLDESTVILRRDLKDETSTLRELGSIEQSSPRSSKLEKQHSLDQSFSAKIRAQLANSPAFHRKRFRDLSDASSRMSKTLPRGLGSASFFNSPIHSNNSSFNHGDYGYCDVYGLCNKLIFVKEDYDAEEGTQGNLMDTMYEGMRRSDPELAAIPGKVSTLDRRLRMKASRPRSLDLSNWSVDSKSSSLYTSSGSEESMGIRLFGGRSVSRNSSSASHKTSGNGSDLGNISENGTITVDIHHSTPRPATDEIASGFKHMIPNWPALIADNNKQTLGKAIHHLNQQSIPTISATAAVTTATTTTTAATTNVNNAAVSTTAPSASASSASVGTLKRKNKNNAAKNNSDGPRTVLTLMGGRGYWRHVWYNSPSAKNNSFSSSNISNLMANSNDAHIVIWEKKL